MYPGKYIFHWPYCSNSGASPPASPPHSSSIPLTPAGGGLCCWSGLHIDTSCAKTMLFVMSPSLLLTFQWRNMMCCDVIRRKTKCQDDSSVMSYLLTSQLHHSKGCCCVSLTTSDVSMTQYCDVIQHMMILLWCHMLWHHKSIICFFS